MVLQIQESTKSLFGQQTKVAAVTFLYDFVTVINRPQQYVYESHLVN